MALSGLHSEVLIEARSERRTPKSWPPEFTPWVFAATVSFSSTWAAVVSKNDDIAQQAFLLLHYIAPTRTVNKR